MLLAVGLAHPWFFSTSSYFLQNLAKSDRDAGNTLGMLLNSAGGLLELVWSWPGLNNSLVASAEA